MFERFRFGSYRIQDTELANHMKKDTKSNGTVNVSVNLLDGSTVNFLLDVSIIRFREMFMSHLFHTYATGVAFICYCRKKPKAVNYWIKYSAISN